MERLLRGGHVVRGVEWADLEVGACVVLPALHQVKLKRDIQGIWIKREAIQKVKLTKGNTEGKCSIVGLGPECVPR